MSDAPATESTETHDAETPAPPSAHDEFESALKKLEAERDAAVASAKAAEEQLAIVTEHAKAVEADLVATITGLDSQVQALKGNDHETIDRLNHETLMMETLRILSSRPATDAEKATFEKLAIKGLAPNMGHYVDPSADPAAFDRQIARARAAHDELQQAAVRARLGLQTRR